MLSDFLFNFLLVYLDDLLIFSESFDDHLQHLEKVLKQICDTGLKLNLEKCQLLRPEVSYLGHTDHLSQGGELPGREDGSSPEVASSSHHQRASVLPGLRRVLPLLCQKLCPSCRSPAPASQLQCQGKEQATGTRWQPLEGGTPEGLPTTEGGPLQCSSTGLC